MIDKVPRAFEKIKEREIEKGCLVKLNFHEAQDEDIQEFAGQGLHADTVYRVLAMDNIDIGDGIPTPTAWIGENKFTQAEIDLFDPYVSFDEKDKELQVFVGVVPVPTEYLRCLID